MMDTISRTVRTMLSKTAIYVKSNEKLYNWYFDLINSGTFTDLYTHEKMLADPVRVDSYAEAIRQQVEPGDVVVDLGTGTGILAFLAAREGANVYAIDNSAFIDVAEQLARHHDINNIQFIQQNSTNFDCEQDVDVLLHEIMGNHLFDENMVEYLLDLKHRVLGQDGVILPSRFQLFLEPVSLKEEYRTPFIEEMTVAGIDYGVLSNNAIVEKYKPPGYDRRWINTAEFDTYLGTPEPILSIDLNDIDSPSTVKTRVQVRRRVENAASVDGLCLFFCVILDDNVQFDTAPDSMNTSWDSRLFRTPRKQYVEGDTIVYSLEMEPLVNADNWTVSLQ